ncbi:hypothetical protein [Dactylosporangium sp. NPDC049140]|uniref:hypothetical protein n=1 Tax=Dactylosporangium sp. NPDC049140 TaxID=3155647 RepID=UPI0034015142
MGRPTRERSRRRRALLRLSLFAVLAASLATLAWTALTGLARGAALSGLVATFAALATLALELVVRLWAPREPAPSAGELADDLSRTVLEQWLEEAHARRLRDPGVLPLKWSATDLPTDDLTAVVESPSVGTVTIHLRGQVEGELDAATGHIGAEFGKIPNGRLVVLGEPGAGKSVLALLLALGLLRRRSSGTAVPVLLSAASWDPTSGGLDEWIVQSVAQSYYQGQVEVPKLLMRDGLLLPIIDGLDEILESARRTAVEHINRAIGVHRPVVVTCRVREYKELITDGAPVLRKAPTVEVAPVAAEDLIGHFEGMDWPPGTDWSPVFAELRGDPEAPVSKALTTPLMVSFARIVYQRLGGTPAALLDRDRFPGRHAVEDHLADKVVDAAYAGDGSDGPAWDAADARRWLTFLATYLHRNHERDLAWWTLSQRLLSRWWAPAIGVISGVAVLVAMTVWVALLDPDEKVGLDSTLWYGWMIATGFGGLVTVMWYAAAGRPPGRLSLASTGTAARLRSGFRVGVAAVAIPAGLPLAFMAGAISLGIGWSTAVVDMYAEFVFAAVTLALSAGAAMAVHSWLEAPPVYSASVGPLEQVHQDRTLTWWGAAAVAVVVSVLNLPAATLGSGVGSLLVQASTDWSGWPGRPAVAQLFAARFRDLTDLLFPVTAVTVGAMVVLPGVLVGMTTLLTRAWPRFVLTRAWLAARGHLPRDLLAFLADARRREILRQRGGVYQFRHIRLQEQLATRQGIRREDTAASSRAGRRRRGQVAVAAVAAVLIVAAVTGLIIAPPDTSSVRFATAYGDGAAALVPDEHSNRLAAFTATDPALHVYDVAARREIASLPGNAGGIRFAQFAPGGRIIAVGAGDNTVETSDDFVRLWSLEYPHPSRPLATIGPAAVAQTTITFNSRGDTALVYMYESDHSFGTAWLWAQGQVVHTFSRAAGFVSVEASPDLTSVLTISTKNLAQVWPSTPAEKPLYEWPDQSSGASAAAYSNDGQTILVKSHRGEKVENRLYGTQKHDDGVPVDCDDPEFVGDGPYLLCSHAGDGHVEFHDSRGLTVRTTSKTQIEVANRSAIIVSTEDRNGIEIWNPTTAQKVADVPGNLRNVNVDLDDALPVLYLSANGSYRMLDTRTGEVLAELHGNYQLTSHRRGNVGLTASEEPDRQLIWNQWLRQPVELDNLAERNSPKYGPGGFLLADEGRDGRVRVRDLATGHTLTTVEHPPWPLDGEVNFSNDTQSFFVFKTESSIELRSRCNPQHTYIGDLAAGGYRAAFDNHGRVLATIGTDGTVELWDAAYGTPLRTLVGHGGTVINMVFTADDTALVTSARDHTVRIWDLHGLPLEPRNSADGTC